MDFLVNQLTQYKGSHDGEYSCLQKSIARLNRRIGWVPQGWVPLYQELVRSLLSLNDAAHGNSTVVGPWVEDEKMVFTSKNLTPVVAGILRKTMQRSLAPARAADFPANPEISVMKTSKCCARDATLRVNYLCSWKFGFPDWKAKNF